MHVLTGHYKEDTVTLTYGGSGMSSFKVKHGEILVQGHFSTPIFGLLDPPASRVHSAIFGGLAKFGVTINDVKLSHGVPNLSEASLSYHVPNFNALVKLSLDKMEVMFFDTPRLQREQVSEIFYKAFGSLLEVAGDTKIREFSLNVVLHGLLEDKESGEFWRSFVAKVPKGLGPASGQGVVFYYGGHDNTTGSSVVLDMSARISGGIFFRTTLNFDGTKVSVKEFPQIAEKAFDTLSSNLDLTLS
jgi:hypothetical protein